MKNTGYHHLFSLRILGFFVCLTWLRKISWNYEVLKGNSVFILVKSNSKRYACCFAKVFPKYHSPVKSSFHGLCTVILNMDGSGWLLTDNFLLFHGTDTKTSFQLMQLDHPLFIYIYTSSIFPVKHDYHLFFIFLLCDSTNFTSLEVQDTGGFWHSSNVLRTLLRNIGFPVFFYLFPQ